MNHPTASEAIDVASLASGSSPPNLLRMRFLRALFPSSCFVAVIRHPIPVSLSTQRWSRTSLASLLDHWIVCHERFSQDVSLLDRVAVVRYEQLVSRAGEVLDRLFAFLGLESISYEVAIDPHADARYFEQWRKRASGSYLAARFERRVRPFGYSLARPEISEERLPFPERVQV